VGYTSNQPLKIQKNWRQKQRGFAYKVIKKYRLKLNKIMFKKYKPKNLLSQIDNK